MKQTAYFLRKCIVLVLFSSIALIMSCNKQDISQNSDVLNHQKSPNSTSSLSDYNVALSVSEDGSLWTYTITRTRTNAKNLSHFIIDLNNCGEESASFGDIIYATVNGSPANLKASEGWGTGCDPQSTTTNFVKFNSLPSATSWVLVMKLDRGYSIYNTAAGWIKAGTSCNQVIIPAPGCPIDPRCSFSQGFFFANGSTQNGASEFWTNGLTIGGVNYNQVQGNQAWNIDRGRGGDQTMNGFFQLGAARLSGVENAVAADAAIIDAYFNGIDIFSRIVTVTSGNSTYSYFNLPASITTPQGVVITTAQVQAAGGRIGSFIDANHCN